MSPTAPTRDLEQRQVALKKANRVRVLRAQMKVDLADGVRSPADLLAHPPWWLMSMSAESFLLALPKWGRVKASRCLIELRISTRKTIGGLSDRQHVALLQRLGGDVRPDLLAALAERRAEAVKAATEPLMPSEHAMVG